MNDDLEDMILKQNVPGKWSRHETASDIRVENEDSDNDKVSEADDEKEYDSNTALEQILENRSVEKGNAKTGVKGVLADYKNFNELNQILEKEKTETKNRIFRRITEGSKQTCNIYDANADDDLLDNLDDQDQDSDGFFENYRQQKLQAK